MGLVLFALELIGGDGMIATMTAVVFARSAAARMAQVGWSADSTC